MPASEFRGCWGVGAPSAFVFCLTLRRDSRRLRTKSSEDAITITPAATKAMKARKPRPTLAELKFSDVAVMFAPVWLEVGVKIIDAVDVVVVDLA